MGVLFHIFVVEAALKNVLKRVVQIHVEYCPPGQTYR